MIGLKPDCFECQHMIGVNPNGGWRCDAFAQIPVEILSLGTKHDHAIEGDGGTRFEAKKTKEEAGYCDVSKDELVCQDCKLYIPSNGCRLVLGEISPVGWCPSYEMSVPVRLVTASVIEEQLGRKDDVEVVRAPHGEVTKTDTDLMKAAGVMIVTADGKVLLLKRSDSGQWAFPGGGIEEGETPEEAALRECEEEIGFRPEIHSEWTRRTANGVDFTTFFSLIPEPFEPKLNDEHTEFQWAAVDDAAIRSMTKLGL